MAITWANILEWETGPLDEIAQTLFEASQGLRKAYENGQDDLKAVQSEGDAVTAMRATTITNLASLERALTNVNGALMAMAYFHEGTRTSQDFANIIAGGKQTTDEEWEALQTAQGKVTEFDRKPWLKKLMEAAE